MRLAVQRANPAGNITLFVLDSVPRENRARISARLMADSDAEQVGFVCPPLHAGSSGRLEMAGGEFCGNAARAFGMLTAMKLGCPKQTQIEISGCAHPISVEMDWFSQTARAQMPLPRFVRKIEADGHWGTLVDLGGIAHFVVEDVLPSLEFFQQAEPLFREIPDLEAYGVIFLDGPKGVMTPLVKVPAAGALIWEGSCGSGSLAAAAAQSQNAPDGLFVRSYVQPAGVVEATVFRRAGKALSAWIGGPAAIDPPTEMEIEFC